MDTEIYEQVKSSVRNLLQIDLTAYKEEQMRRRLDSWLSRSGYASWEKYFLHARENSDEQRRFRDYLTINVSEFFRDQESWVKLRTAILPALLASVPKTRGPQGGLRIWSAGCSIGPEPYSLAILLDEIAPGRNHYLLATDLDRSALQRARSRGPYSAMDIRNVSFQQRLNYFDSGGPPFYVSERISQRVQFREHNMLADPFVPGFDLIVCRNVIIYFTGEAKDALYRKFLAAIRPGGVLFLGATEIIPRPQEIGFQNHGVSFYSRPSRMLS
ncbi:MAG: protein-glutamate O-methyltransferase CheR [Chloroflexi bacterium]|nr:protein-glutamate O-methyltransferase CheR [Chloroflexota bacterium]